MSLIQVLTSLRSGEILLPEDWDQVTRPQQTYLVKWLLSHDPTSRPTSDQLLQSDWLPPVVVEESMMNTMVKNAMKNTSSKAYKHLIEAVMKQPMSLDKDISYDTEAGRINPRLASLGGRLMERARRALELHGAVCLDSPGLLPRGEQWPYTGGESVVVTMTRSGDIVSLPFDLRTQFARYLVRAKLTQLKRYCFGKVLRERKIFGVHPRELKECAVDIVTPGPGGVGMADAEVMMMCEDLVKAVTSNWDNCKLFFRVSHHDLVTGILQHFGVTGVGQEKVIKAMRMWDGLPNRATGQVSARLQALGFSDQVSAGLAPLLEAEVGLSQLGSVLRVITKRKGEAGEAVKAALSHLKEVEARARDLGLTLEVSYCARPSQSAIHDCGLVLQMVRVKFGKSGSKSTDIIAAGGRYDSLLKTFADNFRIAEPDLDTETPRAVGMSISLDKLITMANKGDALKTEICSVVVGGDSSEACKVARELWSSSVSALLIDTARGDEAVEIAKEDGAEFVVMMSPAAESVALVSQLDKDGRMMERKLTSGDVVNHLISCVGKSGESDGVAGLTRLESISSHNTTSSGPIVNYNFDFLDREKYSQSKKKMEVRKSEKLAQALDRFGAGTNVEVVSVGYPDSVVQSMAACLNLVTDREGLMASLGELVRQWPRHRRELREIVELVACLRFTPKNPVIVLFSLEDNTFRIMC